MAQRFSRYVSTGELAKYVNSPEHKMRWNNMLAMATHETQTLIESVGLGPTDLLVYELNTYSYVFLIIPLASGQIITYKSTMGIYGLAIVFEFTDYPINAFFKHNATKVSWDSIYYNN